MTRKARSILTLAIWSVVSLAAGIASAAPEGSEDPAQRGTEFRAVEGGSEMVSGGTLLVEAYVVLWVLLLGFVLISWRRQAKIDTRIDELERALARGGAK